MDMIAEERKRAYRFGLWIVLAGLVMQAAAYATDVSPGYQTNTEKRSLSQSEARRLEVGKPIEREMKGGESHIYEIALTTDQYLNVIVDQRGIDVVEQIIAPDGKQVMEVDSPVGAKGPESVRLIADASGNYRFVIRSSDKTAPAGRYEIRLMVLREATQDDRRLQEAENLDVEAMQLYARKSHQEALTIAEHALAIREKALGSENIEVASSLNRLATLHQAQGDFVKAEVLLQRILTILEKVLGPEHLLIATPLNDLATIYYKKGDYAKVEPLLQRALAIYETGSGSEDPGVAYFLNNLAELYRTKGDYSKAEAFYQRALPILEKALGPEHLLVATSNNNLATIYVEKGDYAKAEPLFQRALAIYEKAVGLENTEVTGSLSNLASLYQNKGEYAKAEPLFQRALLILEKALGPENVEVAALLNNLAALYGEKGDYTKAESLFQRVLAIYEKALGSEHPSVAKTLHNLAAIHDDKGDPERAEQLLQRALLIYERALGSKHPAVANSLNNLAELYKAKGDYAKAEPLYQRALEIYEKAPGSEHPDFANSLNNLAQLYEDKGDYTKAESLFKRALIIFEKALGPVHPLVATSLNNLGVLYQMKDDIPNALVFLSRASDVREGDFLRNLVTGSERQKLAYIAKSANETDVAISWHINLAPTNIEALQLAAKALLRRKGRGLDAMTDAVATVRRRASANDQKPLDQLASTRAQLAFLTLRGLGREGVEEYRANLKVLEEQIDRLEADISVRSSEFRVQQTPITLYNVQRLIPSNAVLVEFVSYRPFDPTKRKGAIRYGKSRYVAYVFHSQGEPTWVELGDAEVINAKLDEFRKALRDKGRNDVNRLARSVDRDVMQPVRRLLGGTRHIFLSPDGALNLVPFAALVDEQNHYLVERYLFTYLTSGRDLLRLNQKVQSKQAGLVVADPDFGELKKGGDVTTGSTSREVVLSDLYFGNLEQTEQEAEELRVLFPQVEVLTRARATEAALKRASGPLILHVATHGFFLDESAQLQDELKGEKTRLVVRRRKDTSNKSVTGHGELINPLMRSGLALAGANTRSGGEDNDGILTALEATGLDLWGTKLVVLSACDTGVGEVKNGDGVYGLRRALVLAGSESQMMSLWPVSDRGTRDLMIDYYKGLKAGLGRSKALRQVQLRMLKNPSRRHPFYWASFIQSGEWANLDGER